MMAELAKASPSTNSLSIKPKQKTSMLHRIKSKITKTLSRPSPRTSINLVKDEPEITDIEASFEQNEQNGESERDEEPRRLNQQEFPSSKAESNDRIDKVLQFNAPLRTLDKIIEEIDYIRDVRPNLERKHVETPEQVEENDSDVETEIAVEETSFHNETNTDFASNVKHVEPDELTYDKVAHTLSEDSQCLNTYSCEMKIDDDENEESHDDGMDAKSSFELIPVRENVDLVIVGVTPIALRGRSNGEAISYTEDEEEFLEPELDAVTTSRLNEATFISFPRNEMISIKEEEFTDNARTDEITLSSVPWRSTGDAKKASTQFPISALAPVATQDEDHAGNPVEDSEELPQVDKVLDDRVLDSGALITVVFGERIVNLLAAEQWGDRQDSFDAIKLVVKKANISTLNPVERRRLLCATLAAVQCGVEDRVAPVMFCALECFRIILKEFARSVPDESTLVGSESKSTLSLNAHLSSVVSALVRKLSDSNKRTQREATKALIRIARLRFVRALPHLLLHLSGREVSPHRQLETLRRLMETVGLTNSPESSLHHHHQLTVETVLHFVTPSLKIAEEKTRSAAIEILADLQTQTNNSTAWSEQLSRAGAAKPELLSVITRRVEELLTEREQQQKTGSSAGSNQTEDKVDSETTFSPAELVDVPQEDAQSSIDLLQSFHLIAQDLVGPVCWRKFTSKTWSDRKEALLNVEKLMAEAKSDLRATRPAFDSAVQNTFVAYSAMLHRALGDNIAPVVNAALDAFVTLVKVYGPCIEWRETVIREITLLVLLQLLAVMRKSNTRTTRAACRGILKLARLPNAHHPIRYVLSCVFGGEDSRACDLQVQMHLLRLLVPEFGFQADGLGASRVLEAVRKGLKDKSARVRRSAADVALSAQRLLGREFVITRLQGVKSVTLKELEKSFVSGIDTGGRPQTVHTTTAESSAPPLIESSDVSLVPIHDLDEFPSRRLLSSAPVGYGGRLQCTPRDDNVSITVSHSHASALSNEEENLMDIILGGH